jgi:glycosyltransferase involved in cell wall biosynthesis
MQQVRERRPSGQPSDTRVELDLIIPALDEESRIRRTLDAILLEADRSNLNLRITVVDNGCVDGTADVVVRTQSERTPVEMISCLTRGKGAAVRAGIDRSTAPYVGYCDADLSTPPSAVPAGLDLLRSGWDVVVGSRRCLGSGYSLPQSRLRRLGSFAFRFMASDLSGPISDTQCGFKLFRADVAKDLFSATNLVGFAFDVEVLAHARRRNHRMIELPIQWTDSPDSTFRPVKDGIRSFRELREARRSLADSDAQEERR